MTKRLISLLLTVVLVLSICPTFTVLAQEGTANGTIFTVENVFAASGSAVKVNILVENNTGIAGATLKVSWSEGLTLIDDENGTVFNPDEIAYQAPKYYKSEGTNFVWYGSEMETIQDGTVLVLTFQVSNDVDDTELLEINITGNGFVDNDGVAFTPQFVNGSVHIVNYIPGDVSGDGTVDGTDLVMYARYISDGCVTDPVGYNIVLNEKAADVNDDGNLDGQDLVMISRYISDGCVTDPESYNIILKPATKCRHKDMQFVPEKAPTCIENGNIAYWHCELCGKYFSEADAVNEIAYIDTVITATGHTVVIDEPKAPTYTETGLTEGSHCSVCNEIIVAQETIPVLEVVYHAIIYRNLQGAESPAITRFAEHEGIAFEDVPAPVRSGYKFLGWYTASEGGTKVDMIKSGTTEDVTVYAHWETISYTITYKNAAKNTNPLTYTIEDSFTLTTPEWAGLEFSRWTDKNGNEVTEIAKGTTGDIELEANWRYARNLAVSNPNKYTYVGGVLDSKSRYYFIYDIGTIENIVLDTMYVTKYKGNTDFTYEESETYKVQTQEAISAAQTIANSVIKSEEWENTSNWVSKHQVGTNVGAKYCPEIEIAKVKAKAYEFSAGWSQIDEETYTETNVQMDSEVNGTEITNQTVSSISFLTENETTKKVTMKLSKDVSPAGYYSYVRAADVKVYAIVTYDPTNGEYYLDIYSMVYRVFDTTLFELAGDEQYAVNIESRDQLDFQIPYAQIPDKFYTVEYNANGGNGEMQKSVHELGITSALLPNEFTKAGYTFGGWKTSKDGATALYTDASSILDIAAAGETVNLYAHWVKNAYTVKYDANKPTNASSSVLNVPGNVICSYDTAVTLGSAPSLTGWTFGGWYRDSACTVKVGNAGEVKANANLTTEPDATVTLYAKWTANTYTVTYDANGGTFEFYGNTVDSVRTDKNYDSEYCDLPRPSRVNCIFEGWYVGSTMVNNDTKVTTVGNHTVVAKWMPMTSGYWTTGDREVNVSTSGHTEYWQTGLNREALKSAGYTQFTIKIKMDGKFGGGDWFKADWWFGIHDPSGDVVVQENGKHWDTKWETREYSFTISVNTIRDDGTIQVIYGHGGDSWDDFRLGKLEIWTTAK